MPTVADRAEILEVLGQDVDAGEDIDWAEIASVTENFTGADLQSILLTAQVLVAQEALGDSLYEGVIASELPSQEENEVRSPEKPHFDHSGSWESNENGDLVKIERVGNFCMEENETNETCGADSVTTHLRNNNKSQAEVIIEKENLEQKEVRVSSQERNNSDEDLDDFERLDVSRVVSQPEKTIGGSVTSSDVGSSDSQLKNTDLRVYRRHIEAALLEVKPSVTLADRRRYQMLYTTFTKSREGNFGQPSPGKRATLA